MARTKVNLQVRRSLDDSVLMLGEAYLKKWKIPSNTPVHLRFGSFRSEVRISPAPRSTGMRIGEELAHRLGLLDGGALCLHYKPGSRTLMLGPLIGVLVSRIRSKTPDRPFGPMTAFCAELTRACGQQGGVVYFFTPDDLGGQMQTVTGWTLREKWDKRSFPVPDVIYNRLNTRRLENDPAVQQFLSDARERWQTVVFNEKYLNKNEVFEALRGEPSVKSYLPESRSCSNPVMLKAMCAKYGTVFLKPVTGSLGNGIIRISRQEEGTYHCYFNNPIGVRKQIFPSLNKLVASLSPRLKKYRYQVQQGLRLIEAEGRPIDFRALVQRGGTGEWAVTSIVARIAAGNNFASNLARGGSLATVVDAAARARLPSAVRAGLQSKLREAALAVAAGLSSRLEGHYAELGVDLAVDIGGRVWLIEVNSKPSKDDNPSTESDTIRPSVRKLVFYSQFAAKF